MKVVINKCFGGFGLSHKAIMRYAEIKGFKLYRYTDENEHFNSHNICLWKEEDRKPLVSYYFSDPNLTAFPDPKSMDPDYKKALEELNEIVRYPDYSTKMFYERNLDRNDLALVQVVEELGSEANGQYAELAIVDIPEGIDWYVDEYDGVESVVEKHRSWS